MENNESALTAIITLGFGAISSVGTIIITRFFDRKKNAIEVQKTTVDIQRSLHEIEKDFMATLLKELADVKHERDEIRDKYSVLYKEHLALSARVLSLEHKLNRELEHDPVD